MLCDGASVPPVCVGGWAGHVAPPTSHTTCTGAQAEKGSQTAAQALSRQLWLPSGLALSSWKPCLVTPDSLVVAMG